MMVPGKAWNLGLIDPEATRRTRFREIFDEDLEDTPFQLNFFDSTDQARKVLVSQPAHGWILVLDLDDPMTDLGEWGEMLASKEVALGLVGLATELSMNRIREALRVGVKEVLQLPLDAEDVQQTLRKVLERIQQDHAQTAELLEKDRAQTALIRELHSLGKQKDEALISTAEELKVPMNSIVSILETVLDEASLKPAEETMVNLALSSARRLGFVFQHLLANLGLKKDRMSFQPKPINLGKVVQEVLTFSQPLLGNKNLQLVNLIGMDLPEVLADEECLEQIFFNLLRFAVTHAEGGEILIRAEHGAMGIWVHFSITPANGLAARSNQALAHPDAGEETPLPLGKTLVLKLTEKLVKRLGGEWHPPERSSQALDLGFFLKEAGVAIGREHRISLPAAVAPSRSLAQGGDGGTDSAADEKDMRILVVDDDPITVRVVCRQLQAYHVEVAENGASALAMLDSQPPFDLIVLDVVMPIISGLRLCKILRQRFHPLELPILLLTIRSEVSDLEEGLEAGANDFLTKPVSGRELMARVRTLLELRKVHRQLKAAQREALAHAKEAGRSEFATTILHNVGNVLNSIHISCSTIADKLRKSKVQGFAKANALLQSKLHELPHFLTVDERGKKLPEYYAKLSELLEGENEALRVEISRVQRRIVMMGDIIETQQIFAKPGDKGQWLVLDPILEESLAVHEELLKDREVLVRKNLQLKRPVFIQRALLVHVMVNLIKNGIEAMDASPQRVLFLQTGLDPEDRAFLSISDTGEGMADASKIYQRGFTTKKHGHGYGLYFCRKAIESMGGTLSAESQGPNQGATFRILFRVEETAPRDETVK